MLLILELVAILKGVLNLLENRFVTAINPDNAQVEYPTIITGIDSLEENVCVENITNPIINNNFAILTPIFRSKTFQLEGCFKITSIKFFPIFVMIFFIIFPYINFVIVFL